MAHLDSKWPKIETAKAIDLKASTDLCELFISGEWKKMNISGFFRVKSYNTKEIVFQHMSVKENVFDHHKRRYEDIFRFRKRNITQYLTSIDIEEVVTTGGYIVEFLEGFIK